MRTGMTAPPRACRLRQGMTIVEILVVVAIIAMLASAGIVQILRARIVTHEQLAVATMKHVAKAAYYYFLLRGEFPDTLTDFAGAAGQPSFLDPSLTADPATFTKQGYVFTYDSPAPPGSFTLTGNPVTHGSTGVRHFLTDQTYTIYATEEDRDATTDDPPIP